MRNIEKFKSPKIEIEELKDIFPSYPKTAYLSFAQVQNETKEADDIFLNWQEIIKGIQKELPTNDALISLLIQEKMDGANAGMMFEQDKLGSKDGIIHVRNRDHILRKNYIVNKDSAAKTQFLPFFNEAHSRQKMLAKMNNQFEQVVAVYGEWLYALHSTVYDSLPSHFMAFDVWLTRDKKFMNPVLAKTVLEDMGFVTPHALAVQATMPLSQLEDTIKLVATECENSNWISNYGQTDKGEGFYVKIGNPITNKLVSRFKIVRDSYKSNLYWNEKVVTKQKLR